MAPLKKTVRFAKTASRKRIAHGKKSGIHKRSVSHKTLVSRKKVGTSKKAAASKKRAASKGAAGRKKSKAKQLPSRPRVICPGCFTELALHGTLSPADASIYATTVDMGGLGLECGNASCSLYIEGVPPVGEDARVNPAIKDCVDKAKEEQTRLKRAEEEDAKENKRKIRAEKKASYAKMYDPFSQARENKIQARLAVLRQQLREEQAKKMEKRWRRVARATARLEKLTKRAEEKQAVTKTTDNA